MRYLAASNVDDLDTFGGFKEKRDGTVVCKNKISQLHVPICPLQTMSEETVRRLSPTRGVVKKDQSFVIKTFSFNQTLLWCRLFAADNVEEKSHDRHTALNH